MGNVHSIFKDVVVRSIDKDLPWLSDKPLGYWDKDGELIEFSVLANIVTWGGIHVGATKARALGLEGEHSIVPLKERRINVQTGERYSAWKYVKAAKFPGHFNEALQDELRYEELIKHLKLDVEYFTGDLECFNYLYFYFLNKLRCFKPLAIESFIAEVAAAYIMLRHGIRVPKEYLPAARLKDWVRILRSGNEKILTIIGIRAESLIR